jgi:rhodanese-related sulfurtransferase
MKKHLLYVIILILFTSDYGLTEESPKILWEKMVAEATANVEEIQAKDLMQWIKEKRDFVLVDVRDRHEVEYGRIEFNNYLNISRGMIDPVAASGGLQPLKTYVLYCKTGSRGVLSAYTLKKLGFSNIYNLQGGINSWIKFGFPVTNGLGTFKAVPYELTGCGEE